MSKIKKLYTPVFFHISQQPGLPFSSPISFFAFLLRRLNSVNLYFIWIRSQSVIIFTVLFPISLQCKLQSRFYFFKNIYKKMYLKVNINWLTKFRNNKLCKSDNFNQQLPKFFHLFQITTALFKTKRFVSSNSF